MQIILKKLELVQQHGATTIIVEVTTNEPAIGMVVPNALRQLADNIEEGKVIEGTISAQRHFYNLQSK